MNLHHDAFSSGQILSKTWLAEELEKVIVAEIILQPLNIVALGGWYGLANFILQVRNNINIKKFVSIDLDADACKIADTINESWVWKNWQFKSKWADANHVDLTEFDVVINTSTEHFAQRSWFDNIAEGTLVALQSNDMKHDDHCHNHETLAEFEKEFPVSKLLYSGEKSFQYPDWGFTRFMIIGIK